MAHDTEEQRLRRVCSILSIGVMRLIQARKTTGQHDGELEASTGSSDTDGRGK